MANQIIIRRSAVATDGPLGEPPIGKRPTISEAALGELFVNTASGQVFTKTNFRGNEQIVDLTENQKITISGDANAVGKSNLVLTLSNTGVTAGTYTKVTVDAKGRVIAAANIATSDMPFIDFAKLTSLPNTLSGYGIVDAQPLDPDLTSIAALSQTSGFLKKIGINQWSLINDTFQMPSIVFSGQSDLRIDGPQINSSNTTIISASLQTVNTNSGTFGNNQKVPVLTINEKGLVTGSSQVSIFYPVVSVAGKTGAVNLDYTDIQGAAPVTDPTFHGTVTVLGSLVLDSSSTIGLGSGLVGEISKISEFKNINGVSGNYILDSFNVSDFHSCEYFIQAKVNNNIGFEAVKLILVQDGTNAFLTEYCRTGTIAENVQFTAEINGANVELRYTQTGDVTVTAVRTALN